MSITGNQFFICAGLLITGFVTAAHADSVTTQLGYKRWDAQHIEDVKALLPDKASVESFINDMYVQANANNPVWANNVPATVGPYEFAQLHNDGSYQFVAVVNSSGPERPFYRTLAIVDNKNGKLSMTELKTNTLGFEDDIDAIVVDINKDGKHEIVVPRRLGDLVGTATPSPELDDIYVWNGNKFEQRDSSFKDYYRNTVLPKIQKNMTAKQQEKESTKLAGDPSHTSEHALWVRDHQLYLDEYQKEIDAINEILKQ
ncbi:MAG TPA: hypothetical protein VLG68_01770 [Gammaproteobacteria bacterium]|nr:hypothetical protein [Gammaproteobacteria bacterium]